MGRTYCPPQTPQMFQVQVECFLRNPDSEPVGVKDILTFEFSGEVVSNFLDVGFVLFPSYRPGILVPQFPEQRCEAPPQFRAPLVIGRVRGIYACPLKRPLYLAGYHFTLNEFPFRHIRSSPFQSGLRAGGSQCLHQSLAEVKCSSNAFTRTAKTENA